VQPPCIVGDLHANGQAHAAAIRAARARVVVFPELSLTGYDLKAPLVSTGLDALGPVVAACEGAGSVALVGAPVGDSHGRHYIATLRVTAAGVDVVCRKTWLGAGESARFSPGDGPGVIDVDGWSLGLGICKDNGTPQHRAQVASLGVDVYATGVLHRPDQLSMQQEWGAAMARQCSAHVVFASFAGPTGSGYAATAGSSTIWSPAGTVLAQAGLEPGGIARATIPAAAGRPSCEGGEGLV